jgi:hypothetical protein
MRDDKGMTVLHLAAGFNKRVVLVLLLNGVAKIGKPFSLGTVLHVAVFVGEETYYTHCYNVELILMLEGRSNSLWIGYASWL